MFQMRLNYIYIHYHRFSRIIPTVIQDFDVSGWKINIMRLFSSILLNKIGWFTLYQDKNYFQFFLLNIDDKNMSSLFHYKNETEWLSIWHFNSQTLGNNFVLLLSCLSNDFFEVILFWQQLLRTFIHEINRSLTLCFMKKYQIESNKIVNEIE